MVKFQYKVQNDNMVRFLQKILSSFLLRYSLLSQKMLCCDKRNIDTQNETIPPTKPGTKSSPVTKSTCSNLEMSKKKCLKVFPSNIGKKSKLYEKQIE